MEYAAMLIWFLVAIAGHMVLMRLPVRGSSVARFVVAAGLASIGLAVCIGLSSWASLAAWAAYAFACELYVFLFTLVVSSVSVRTLLLLRDESRRAGPVMAPVQGFAPQGSDVPSPRFTGGRLLSQEVGAAMVRRRLRRMVAVGLLAPVGAGFKVTHKGRGLLRVFAFLQGFFGHAAPASGQAPEPAWGPQTSRLRPIDTFPRSNL